ncbi:hypothetical protein KKB83_01700 [Patescibacteria group bacterium]|nr:hypothetical protein [Patescibacteria group bacterium]
MQKCVNCGEPIDETNANKYRDTHSRGIICGKCAVEFAARLMESDENKNPMPPEINNPNIVAWDPRNGTGKEKLKETLHKPS